MTVVQMQVFVSFSFTSFVVLVLMRVVGYVGYMIVECQLELGVTYMRLYKSRQAISVSRSSAPFNKLHRLTERDSRLEHYFALFGGLGLNLGYLATSSAKSDVIFLLGGPDFL